MGIKDNFTVLFGSGIDYAGKKAETIKLQADLTKTAASIESAYAALGRAVMREESANESFLAVYGSRVSAVRELERHAAETQARIDELSRTQGVPSAAFAALPKTAPVGKCPACGASVLVDSMFCPTCISSWGRRPRKRPPLVPRKLESVPASRRRRRSRT